MILRRATFSPQPFTVVYAGDSVTAPGVSWMDGAVTTLQANYKGMVAVNSGFPGNQVADIDTGWAARIAQFRPTHLVLLIGINDARLLGAVTGPQFQASYQSIINKTRAQFPACKITHCTLMVANEDWPTGANVADPFIEDFCTRIRNVYAADRAAFPGLAYLLDFRAQLYAVQEPIANPGHLTNSVLYDAPGLHPNAACKLLACAQYLATVPFP